MRSRLIISTVLLFFTICAHAQWARYAKSRAFSRTSAVATDNAGALYAGGIMTCITSFEGDSLLNNSCVEVSLPPPANPQIDAFLSKYDEDGNRLWLNHYIGSEGNKLLLADIAVDGAGNCYLTGSFTNKVNFNGGPALVNADPTTEFFLVKVRSDGVTDWAITQPLDDEAEASAQKISVSATAVYVTGFIRGKFQIGSYSDSVGRNASFVSAFDLSGNSLWTKNFKEVNANGSSYGKAIEAVDDNIWVFSSFADSVKFENDTILPPASLATTGIICLFDAAGNLQDSVLTSTPFIEDIKLHLPDASLYFTGRAENVTTFGAGNLFATAGIRAFVASYTMDLATRNWVIPLTDGASASLTGRDLDVNDDGSIIAGGTFNAATLTASTAPPITATGGGGQSGYVLKLDAAGNGLWLQSFGGAGEDAIVSVASVDDDHIFGGGYFNEYLRVAGDELFGDASSSNGFMARLDVCPLLLAEMLSPDSTYVCTGDSSLFNVLTNATYSYQWIKDEAPVPGAVAPSLFVKESGVYRASVTGLGCTKLTPAASLFLYTLPDRTVFTTDSLENCAGDSVLLTGPRSSYTFQWRDEGISIPGEIGMEINIKTEGDYSLNIRDVNGCMVVSDTFNVRFHAYPSDILSPPGKHEFCAGDSIALQADAALPDMKYFWKKNGISLPRDTFSLFYPKTEGIYNVVIRNATGCETLSLRDTIVVTEPPIVDLKMPPSGEICQGGFKQLITYQASDQSYQWMLNGAPMAGAVTNSINATLPGQYRVLTRNASCERFSDFYDLAVNPLPSAAIVNNSTIALCEGESYQLHAQQAPLYSYQWFQNTDAVSGATQPDLPVTQTGNYAVRITNQFNCEVMSAGTFVNVNLKPPASITPQGATTFCNGNSVELRANAGNGLTYQWIRDGSVLPGATLLYMQAALSGVYEVRVKNAMNCERISPPRQVSVIPIPDATLMSATGSATICERDSLLLRSGASTTYAYSWMFNNQPIPNTTAQEFYAKKPGFYKVIASVGACRDTSSVMLLSLRPNPLPLVTRDGEFLSIALFGDIQWYRNNVALPVEKLQAVRVTDNGNYKVSVINTAGCTAWSEPVAMCLPVPDIKTANDILTASISNATYQWEYKNITITGATQQQLKAQQSGDYSVVVTNDGCAMETFPVTVCVPFPYIIQDSFSKILKAFPNPATAYQWYFEGEPVADGNTQVHIPDEYGTYAVTITDLEGCVSSSEPFVVGPVTGMIRDVLNGINIYPNPVSHQLTVALQHLSPSEDFVLIILDVVGREVHRQGITESLSRINFATQSAGVYTIIVEDKTGNKNAWRVVKY